MLHAALTLSHVAHGRLRAIDTSRAQAAPGVVSIITAADIPGKNDIAPIAANEPLFAADVVQYAGQPVAAVAAETRDQALAAAKLVTVDIEPLPAILTVAQALEANSVLCPAQTLECGNVTEALAKAQRRIKGELTVGGQEHFYLEGQVAVAVPGEDDGLLVHCATQHPSEVQAICARLLGLELNRITSIVRRLGGGFGGKESNASWFAGIAALFAQRTGRAVKIRLPRDVDMVTTGKRHGFLMRYEVGFDNQGRISALDALLAANGGCTLDHTAAVLTRAITHADNCYWIKNYRVTGVACKTHTVSNTAFRGYGGPQGVLLMEEVVERVARLLGKTPEAIRALNYYGDATSNVTPYGHALKDNLIAHCVAQVMSDSNWDESPAIDRCVQSRKFNRQARPRIVSAEVRNLLHKGAPQPSGSAGPCLQRRLYSTQSRWHRNGSRPLHQGGAGGRRSVQRRRRQNSYNADLDWRSPQHVADRRLNRFRP